MRYYDETLSNLNAAYLAQAQPYFKPDGGKMPDDLLEAKTSLDAAYEAVYDGSPEKLAFADRQIVRLRKLLKRPE